MAKSPDAFRTISEVSDWLDTPAHVLRFWESRFTQVKPVKRAGGRRYYRPADMMLLGGIKQLLHGEGVTIRGVQKVLREQGIKHVSSLSAALDDAPETAEKAPLKTPKTIDVVATAASPEPEGAKVIPLRGQSPEKPEVDAAKEPDPTPEPEAPIEASEILSDVPQDAPPAEFTPEDLMAEPDDFGESLFEEDDVADADTDGNSAQDSTPDSNATDHDKEAEDDKNFFAQNDAKAGDTAPQSAPGFVTGSKKNRMEILAQAADETIETDSPSAGTMTLRDAADLEKIRQLYAQLQNLRDRMAEHG